MKRLLIKNVMNSFSKVKQHITSRLPNVWVFIIALMLSLGLSTAQAKDRISYFHSDISGSPIAATNDNGDVLWEETYKPYGERLDTSNSDNKSNNNQWFTGKQEEASLGLQYFGARWYHQASGRFISRDPAGVLAHVESNPMMFNRYAYANNNPYKYVDPDGQLPFLIPLAIFIAKEIISEGVEQVTGLPMPTAKNGLKYAIKQANKQIAKEGMKQAAKIVKETGKSVAKGGERLATGFKGRKGVELKNTRYQKTRNSNGEVGGRQYSGHAFDQMQNRGVMPSSVENAMKYGKSSPDPIKGRTRYFDADNNITVVSEAKKVVTVMRGKR
jgi:RHS repeat-associated protein